ncbi:beta-lactamase family protein [Allosphingosinicella flava]|uniref:Beta-lactamase family protein n=1 Tax=Allosphingosinicella flava TaxID=2771430 RepID=A0A7T2GI76_9SPHN|nr:serine hydrolase domain-containing protein [Sphingosinicella flava]QPQ54360.1 beta-lactamase family protein [Sphingosinicella flava]
MRAARLLALIAALAGAVPASTEPDVAPVDTALQSFVDQGALTGYAVEIWKDGALVGRSAYGKRDLATGAPMQTDTIVRAYSMTKPVTAVAMMILHDQGKWRPEDPVAKYLPELADLKVWKSLDAAGKPILVPPASQPNMAQLMSHMAGFQYDMGRGGIDDLYRRADLWGAKDNRDFLARVARLPLRYDPGTGWEYSIAMDLQGAIIERLSGMPLRDFMKRHIFDPLGMTDTDFRVPQEKLPRLATVYEWKDGKPIEVTSHPLGNDPTAMPGFASGGGGLFSTAPDYARFARMLLGKGTLDGKRIISEEAASTIMSPKLPPEILNGGYGIGLQQMRPGYEYGYNGVVVTDPQAAKVALGRGSYLWDGLATTWFWVDPEHDIVFVGMVQRIAAEGGPPLQPASQAAVKAAFFPD